MKGLQPLLQFKCGRKVLKPLPDLYKVTTFLSWARLRNTSCFNSLCFFFWDNILAMGTSPEEELFVQSLLFLTTSGQYNLTGTYPAAWEAELKGSTEKQAGTVLHTQAVRSSREKLLCTNKVC